MKQSDYQQFCSIMLETAEAVDKALSPEKIAVFFKDLADIDIRAIRYAMERHRKESEFFPRVAKVRELAKLWKPPVPQGIAGRDVKLLESASDKEARLAKHKERLHAIVSSLETLDMKYGTELNRNSPEFRERLNVLQAQKEMVRGMKE